MKQNQYFTSLPLFIAVAVFFLILKPVFAQVAIDSTSTAESTVSTTPVRQLISEPTIRVGLYKTKDPVKFSSDFAYDVWIDGKVKGTVLAKTLAVLIYKKGIYTLKSKSLAVTSTKYIRFLPEEPQAFFVLTNYKHLVKGRGKVNFNVYRGGLEYRYSPKSKQPYIINELPLDSYVAGVAETYNTAPEEYAKALMVAARSYANALISKNQPTEQRMFDVYPTTNDQVYLGYNSELFMPRIAKAAADTAGEMVAYNGNLVITPYFSHSNGFTKSWKDSSRPWLQSVEAVYDKYKKTSGHGFGMSNHDAEERAIKDGWTYDQILGYYYSSTTVERVY